MAALCRPINPKPPNHYHKNQNHKPSTNKSTITYPNRHAGGAHSPSGLRPEYHPTQLRVPTRDGRLAMMLQCSSECSSAGPKKTPQLIYIKVGGSEKKKKKIQHSIIYIYKNIYKNTNTTPLRAPRLGCHLP